MSTALPFAGVGELVSSPAESAAFGFEVARLSIGGAWKEHVSGADELARQVVEILKQATAETVILRFPSELVAIARLDQPGGRRLQHAGTLLYWEDPLSEDSLLGAGFEAVVSSGGLEPPAGFVNSAATLVADSFNGYINHYAYNLQIPPDIARDGYVDWTRRTIADPAGVSILLREGDRAIAMATLKIHASGEAVVGEVELAAVAPDQQGGGRYRDLWRAIRGTARESGAKRLIISTQASNVRVQRAWARLGLIPLIAFDTVHAISHQTVGAPPSSD